MKKIIALAVVAAACSTTTFAQSVGKVYGEVAYGLLTAKDTSTESVGSFKPTLARFTLGTVVTDNVAIEGSITQGISSDSTVAGATNIDVKTKTGYAVAIRPFVNLTNDIELFGRVGTSRNKLGVTASQGNQSQNFDMKTTNTFYGVGVAYKINNNLNAVVDYTKFANKEDTDLSLVAIGLRYNF